MIHPDDRDFHYSSDSEWDNAEASEIGRERPDLAWVLTDRDVWHRNPYYQGPPVPHPDFEGDDNDGQGRVPEWTDLDGGEGECECPF